MNETELHSRLVTEADVVRGSVPPSVDQLTTLARAKRHRRRLGVAGAIGGAVAAAVCTTWLVNDLSEASDREAVDPSANAPKTADGSLDCASDLRQVRGSGFSDGPRHFTNLDLLSRFYFGDAASSVVEVDPDDSIIVNPGAAPQVRLFVHRNDAGWAVTRMEACERAVLPPPGGIQP